MKNTLDLDDQILSYLSTQKGASTRQICNKCLGQILQHGYVRPGTEKMQWVYYGLSKMKKQGIVSSDYPGYWRITKPAEQ